MNQKVQKAIIVTFHSKKEILSTLIKELITLLEFSFSIVSKGNLTINFIAKSNVILAFNVKIDSS